LYWRVDFDLAETIPLLRSFMRTQTVSFSLPTKLTNSIPLGIIPHAILPKNVILPATLKMDADTVLLLHHNSIARQLTILAFDTFCDVTKRDLISWCRSQQTPTNFHSMVTSFNNTQYWAVSIILSQSAPKKRAQLIIKLLKIAEVLREINNFHSIVAIMAALSHNSIYRLTQTWDQLSKKQKQKYQTLTEISLPNLSFASYRNAIKNCQGPCVPFGVFASDLILIFEGNPSELTPGIINLNRLKLMSSVIGDVENYQKAPYDFLPIVQILQSLDFLKDAKKQTDKEFYERSLELEPRRVG